MRVRSVARFWPGLALGLLINCGGTQSQPEQPGAIVVGEGEPESEPVPPADAHRVSVEFLKELQEILLDETYGTAGTPDRFVTSYLWSLYVPRGKAVAEEHRYNRAFLAENPGFEYDDPRDGFADRLFALPRTPEFIEAVFNARKAWIFEALPPGQYRDLHLDVYVDGLLEVKRHMFSQPNYESTLRSLLIRLSTPPSGDTGVPYPSSTNRYEPELFGELWNVQVEAYVNGKLCHSEPDCVREATNLTLWMHSFWVRRFSEHNAVVVEKILKEIQKHYSG